jgi:hypothetical protein
MFAKSGNYFYKFKLKKPKEIRIKILKLKLHLGWLSKLNKVNNSSVKAKIKIKNQKLIQIKIYLLLHTSEHLLKRKS